MPTSISHNLVVGFYSRVNTQEYSDSSQIGRNGESLSPTYVHIPCPSSIGPQPREAALDLSGLCGYGFLLCGEHGNQQDVAVG